MTDNTDPYVAGAIGEIVLDNPDLSAEEIKKAIEQLRQDDEHKRRFLSEIKARVPEATYFWDMEKEAVCLRGITLR